MILRISNILTYDVSLRNLFISNLLRSLKKDSFVKLDISKGTYKDFIISDLFVKILDELIKKNIVGKFNLSSNIPIKVSEIVNQIIKGYGVGTIIMSEKIKKKNNSFILKNNKLKKIVRFKTSKKKFYNIVLNLEKIECIRFL